MVTDEELVSRLHELLSTSDLNTTTNTILRRKLEEDLGISLSDKKSFIRQQVDLYLQSHFQPQEQQEEEIQQQEEEIQQQEEEIQQQEEEIQQQEEEIQQQQQVEQEGEEEEEEEEEEEAEGEEEELEDVEEGSGNEKTPVLRTRSKKQKNKVKKRGGGGGGGFTKVCSLSPELQKFTGVSELARTEVVKQIWKYIREKNLQDPSDKRNIICDDALRALFDVDSVNMFTMNKALSKHIWPLESNGKEQEEGEADEADEEGCGDDMARAKATKRSKKENKTVKGKGGGGGFTKVCSLSPELQKFTGVPELARTGVVKHMWNYIRENNLQDPSDKRNIICDDVLRALFNVDSINMFQMNKALAKHIWPLDSDAAASVNSTPKEKQPKHEREDPDESKRKEKRQKGSGVDTSPLSDALVKFLGTGETSLARTDVIKRIWNYINHKNLQDPFDSGRIISDEKLKELFEVDAFDRLAVSKLLKSHFVKAEK